MKIKVFCIVLIPSKGTKILEFNQYQKFHADLEGLVEKVDGCKK